MNQFACSPCHLRAYVEKYDSTNHKFVKKNGSVFLTRENSKKKKEKLPSIHVFSNHEQKNFEKKGWKAWKFGARIETRNERVTNPRRVPTCKHTPLEAAIPYALVHEGAVQSDDCAIKHWHNVSPRWLNTANTPLDRMRTLFFEGRPARSWAPSERDDTPGPGLCRRGLASLHFVPSVGAYAPSSRF